jgi:hypothetical protein
LQQWQQQQQKQQNQQQQQQQQYQQQQQHHQQQQLWGHSSVPGKPLVLPVALSKHRKYRIIPAFRKSAPRDLCVTAQVILNLNPKKSKTRKA